MEVNGGQITMSQSVVLATSGKNSAKNARVSACVLYIFQLPAITLRRLRELIGWSTPPRRAICARQEIPATRLRRSRYAKSCPLRRIDVPPQPNLRRRQSKSHQKPLRPRPL